MSYYVAVDIGGTQMRAACYLDNDLSPVKVDRISTRHPTLTPLQRLHALVESIWPKDKSVKAIGIAAAGPSDPYEGIVREAPNIPGWVNVPLRQSLEDQFKTPVALGNDANLAALGEWRYGAGQGHHDLVYLTISTGIGGGVITNDQLLLGAHGLAAELGHVTIQPDGPLCSCGKRGHLEALASGPAMAHWVEQELKNGRASVLAPGKDLTAKAIGQAALKGDPLATAAIARSGAFIGEALADYLHIFNPSVVIIGGGVSQTGALLMDPMRAAMQKHVLSPYYLEDLKLTTAALGDDAGLVGALALAHSMVEEKIAVNPSITDS